MSYSEGFAEHRKIVQQNFQQQMVPSYRHIIIRETKVLENASHGHLKRYRGLYMQQRISDRLC